MLLAVLLSQVLWLWSQPIPAVNSVPAGCASGSMLSWNGANWACTASGGPVPVGGVILVASGNCPTGYTANASFVLTGILVGSKACTKD